MGKVEVELFKKCDEEAVEIVKAYILKNLEGIEEKINRPIQIVIDFKYESYSGRSYLISSDYGNMRYSVDYIFESGEWILDVYEHTKRLYIDDCWYNEPVFKEEE